MFAHPRLAASQPTRPPLHTHFLGRASATPADRFRKLSLRSSVFNRVHRDLPPTCICSYPVPGTSIRLSATPYRSPQQVHITPRRSFSKTEPLQLSFWLGAPKPSSIMRSLIPTLQASMLSRSTMKRSIMPSRRERKFGDSSTISVQVE